MTINLDTVSSLVNAADWFTVTRVTARVSAVLGSYVIEIEGEPLEALLAMNKKGELGEVLAISGVAHPPDHSWVVAFRIDENGERVAKNARGDAVDEIRPRLRELIGQ